MKYVIARHPTTGYYLPVVFADEVGHVLVVTALLMELKVPVSGMREVVVGAGYATGGGTRVRVVPGKEAEGVGIGPGELDEFVLQMFLGEGLSGLELQNVVMFAELRGVGKAVEELSAHKVKGKVGVKAARKPQPQGRKKVTSRKSRK